MFLFVSFCYIWISFFGKVFLFVFVGFFFFFVFLPNMAQITSQKYLFWCHILYPKIPATGNFSQVVHVHLMLHSAHEWPLCLKDPCIPSLLKSSIFPARICSNIKFSLIFSPLNSIHHTHLVYIYKHFRNT